MATMPAARYDAAAVGLAGTAYTLGGIDGGWSVVNVSTALD